MRQILTWATTGLLLLIASLSVLANPASEHRVDPEGQRAFETAQNQAWSNGQTTEPEHRFAGEPSRSDPDREPYPEDETYTNSDHKAYASGALSRIYRSSRNYNGYSGRREHSPETGASTYYRRGGHSSYEHRSYRKHQYGHGLRHYRHPGYGNKHRHGGYPRHYGYQKPHRYGHGLRHGYRGSLHYRGGSGHSGFGGSVHIRK